MRDPLLYWFCRALDQHDDVCCRVVVPKSALVNASGINPAFARYISSATAWDRLVAIFRTDQDSKLNPDWAYGFRVGSALAVDGAADDFGYSANAVRMSYVLGTKVHSYALETGISIPYIFSGAPRGDSLRDPSSARRVGWFCLDAEPLLAGIDGLINSTGSLKSSIITSGKVASDIESHRINIPIWAISEIYLDYLLSQIDVLVDLSEKISGDTHRWALINARAIGLPVFARWSEPDMEFGSGVIRGAGDPAKFSQYVFAVLSADPGLARFAPFEPSGAFIDAGLKAAGVMLNLDVPSLARSMVGSDAINRDRSGALFYATNGHGLGHVQRVSTLCRAIAAHVKDDPLTVATFPSCFEFVGSRGFSILPLVSRQVARRDLAVEAANLKRLGTVLNEAKLFVFDGGHPYDSVVAAVQDFDGRSVWIRRGLWQTSPETMRSLSRERYFDHVLVPSEAFDELNHEIDSSVVPTAAFGPVVPQPEGLATVRDYLGDVKADKRALCVTLLGSGSNPERLDMLKTVLHWFEKNKDYANVVIGWPQSLFHVDISSYPNSKFLRTIWGTAFLHEADFIVAAAGYNVFHESLYYRKPAIFVPQRAAWLDEQHKRAAAAASRVVAVSVEEDDPAALVGALDAMAGGRLYDLKSNLAALTLPDPGNDDMASLIRQIGALQ